VLIPAILKEKANIDKDVSIIGIGSRIEIWDKNTYEKYAQEAETKYESAAEALNNEDR
jgi:MraZ protein